MTCSILISKTDIHESAWKANWSDRRYRYLTHHAYLKNSGRQSISQSIAVEEPSFGFQSKVSTSHKSVGKEHLRCGVRKDFKGAGSGACPGAGEVQSGRRLAPAPGQASCLVQEGAGGTSTPRRNTKNQLSQLREVSFRIRLIRLDHLIAQSINQNQPPNQIT